MMIIDNEFEFGQSVYLKTDAEQSKRMVTGINIKPNNQLVYAVTCDIHTSYHYEFELSTEIDELIKVK